MATSASSEHRSRTRRDDDRFRQMAGRRAFGEINQIVLVHATSIHNRKARNFPLRLSGQDTALYEAATNLLYAGFTRGSGSYPPRAEESGGLDPD